MESGLINTQRTEKHKYKLSVGRAQLRLAQHYLSRTPALETQAISVLRDQAIGGCAHAQSHLGYILNTSREHQNYDEGNKWLFVAAIYGERTAQYNLGVSYTFGRGVIQDLSRANVWFHLSALSGYLDALARVGAAYCLGLHVDADMKVGEEILQMTAKHGHQASKNYFKNS